MCCQDVAVSEFKNTRNCNMILEGLICWDEKDYCPKYVIGSHDESHKRCEDHVRRFRLHEDEKGLTECSPAKEDAVFHKAVVITNIVGSSISAVAVLLSMLLFLILEAWHLPRIRIHINLFIALLLKNISCITLYYYIVSDPVFIENNKIGCRILVVISNYFILSSYFWMFCECLHLHQALYVIFVRDNTPLTGYAFVGWGIPLLVTGLYTASMSYLEYTDRCWIDISNSAWIVSLFILISLLVSFVYLMNVIRVLINRLHRAPSVESLFATRKTARMALLMIPLFGIHFALIPFRPTPETITGKIYEIFLTLVSSLQGTCISAFLCFTNHEAVAFLQTGVNRIREIFALAVVEEEPNPADVVAGIEMM